MARKNLYISNVKPNLEKISEMASQGLTQTQIASSLGVTTRSFQKYLEVEEDLRKAMSTGRELAIRDIENAMYKSALGGIETIKKGMKVKKVIYENGKKKAEVESVEPYDEQIYNKPDTQAGIFLLKNWAKEKYSSDPLMHDLKVQELELKKKVAMIDEEEEFNPFS